LVFAAPDRNALCTSLVTGVCGPSLGGVNESVCLTAFTGTADGADGDTMGDTIGCRQTYAAMATNASQIHYCNLAGFTGGGVCGKPLDTSCRTIVNLCGTAEFTDVNDCMTANGPNAAFVGSRNGAAAAAENSLECRVYHATAGVTTGVAAHCSSHTGNKTNAGVCDGSVNIVAAHHCAQILGACSATPQYASFGSCMGSFALFPPSTSWAATNVNDQASRVYHAVAGVALSNTSYHCPHGGPSGGGLYAAYGPWQSLSANPQCATAAPGLAVTVGAVLASWAAADLQAVIPPGNAAAYTSAIVSGNTVLCRIYHLSVAATDAGQAAIHCVHGSVGGAGACGNATLNVCGMLAAACPATVPFNNTAACSTLVETLVSQNKTGNLMSIAAQTDDTLGCRIYHGGMALGAKMMMNATAQAGLCAMAATGCGASMPPSMAAPTMASPAPVLAASVALVLLPLFV